VETEAGDVDDIKWLDDIEMRAWRVLLTATSRLNAVLDHELQADSGIPLSEYEVLVGLSEAPDRRLRMSELADFLHLSPSGLTRRLDRLVRAGLVVRERCPSDRRGSYAVLTNAGFERLVEAAPGHLRGVRHHFIDRFAPAELVELSEMLERVIETDAEAETPQPVELRRGA